LAASFALLAQWPAPAAFAKTKCPRKANDAQRGMLVTPPIKLTPSQQSTQKLVNFGEHRNRKTLGHLTVITDQPLPNGVTPAQISYDVVLSRTGDTLETEDFRDPTFSDPTIAPDRRSITFSVCLNPSGVAAGKYVGAITVSGPPGLGTASLNLTLNAKSQDFLLKAGVALLAAFLLLLVKDAATVKTAA
jgi:hypothetical protein